MNVRLTLRAESDLEGIFRYIAADSETAAREVVAAILDALNVLEQFPAAGRSRDDLFDGLRSWPALQYAAYYVIEENEVLIVRILGGGQNVGPGAF